MLSDGKSVDVPPSKGALPMTSPTFPSFLGVATIPRVQNNDTAFPIRLHEMIEWVECNYPDSIRPIYWLKNGHAFVIQDHDSLVKSVLPHFFKQVKVESFTRKLNRWGFRIIKYGPDKGAYMHKDFYRWELPVSITSMCRDKKRNRKPNDNSVKGYRDYQQVAKIPRHNKKDEKMPLAEQALRALDSNTTDMIQFNYERTFSPDASSNYRNLGTAGGHTFQQNLAGNITSQLRPISQNNTNLLNLPQNLECSSQTFPTEPMNNLPARTEQAKCVVFDNSKMMGGEVNIVADPNNIVTNEWYTSNSIKFAHNMMMYAASRRFGTSIDRSSFNPNISDGNTNEFNSSCFCSKGITSPLAVFAPNTHLDINLGEVDDSFSGTVTSNRACMENNTTRFYSGDIISPLAAFANNSDLDINQVEGGYPGIVASNIFHTENKATGFYSEDTRSPLAVYAPNSERDINLGQAKSNHPGTVKTDRAYNGNNTTCFCSEDNMLFPLAASASNSDLDYNQVEGRYPGIVTSNVSYNVNNTTDFSSGDDMLSPLSVFAPDCNRDIRQGQVEDGCSGFVIDNRFFKEKNTSGLYSDSYKRSSFAVFSHNCDQNINQGHADTRYPGTVVDNGAYKKNDDEIEEANEQEIDRDLRDFFARLEKSIWEDK